MIIGKKVQNHSNNIACFGKMCYTVNNTLWII